MSAKASHISGIWSVCPVVCSDAHQRKHQSSASLAIVRDIHRWPVDSPHKRTIMQYFHLMTSSTSTSPFLKLLSRASSCYVPLFKWFLSFLFHHYQFLRWWTDVIFFLFIHQWTDPERSVRCCSAVPFQLRGNSLVLCTDNSASFPRYEVGNLSWLSCEPRFELLLTRLVHSIHSSTWSACLQVIPWAASGAKHIAVSPRTSGSPDSNRCWS